MRQRVASWMVLHALLWAAVGAGAVVAAERWRGRGPSLADLAEEATSRMGELDLSAAQQEQLAAIAQRWRSELTAKEVAWQASVDAAAAAADREVEALLTPEQARRWRARGIGAASN